MRLARFPLSALSAGMVAVLISFASNIPLFVQMFAVAHFSPGQSVSSLTSMYLLLGLLGAGLCLIYKAPVILGWNTPGLAVLIAEGSRFTPNDVVGALLLSGAVLALIGVSGAFDAVARRIPPALASALLAGVLLPFVLRGVAAIPAAPALTLPLLGTYLLGRAFFPRYAVPAALVMGLGAAALGGQLHFDAPHPLGHLELIAPAFGFSAALTLALPMTLLALTAQNLTGIAILQSSGYSRVPVRPLITLTGLAATLAAPFGSLTLNMGAITAALCTGPDAHPDPAKRYLAGLTCAGGYLALSLGAGALLGLASAFPAALMQTLAGVALLGAVMGGLEGVLRDAYWREPALLTLVVTASGFSLLGLSGAVWGLGLGWGLAWLRARGTR
ncbi:benzoate/H(+) symporter BenE family transporter [Deinococcus rubellus]|uniref:Benzoate/H(+) symporter BenE family transporter n=1 Tax=Deinococcus rubellus TaxID=1889240 RepID=A0ABY5YD35_9DEIO|nr:benzoate/H(+) symporter BenE family transporter [Deinococcus rubellus]UWX62972.1 benzoate/H(+) symporter BenE family transporter [Deinococcus rubellus]